MKSLRLLCLILAVTYSDGNKRYDINREARSAYGRNITGVLAKFRRSPDYLKILQQKVAILHDELTDVTLLTLSFYRNKLNIRIGDITGVNATTVNEVQMQQPSSSTSEPTLRFHRYSRRQGDNASEMARLTRIDRIDSYSKLTSTLTVQERNEFKNVGFQYIGDCIHAIAENMGTEVIGGGKPSPLAQNETPGLPTPSAEEEPDDHVDHLWSLVKATSPYVINNTRLHKH